MQVYQIRSENGFYVPGGGASFRGSKIHSPIFTTIDDATRIITNNISLYKELISHDYNLRNSRYIQEQVASWNSAVIVIYDLVEFGVHSNS